MPYKQGWETLVKEVAKQMEKEEVVAQEEEQHYHRGR